jgi:hypothetical protein
MTAEELGRLTIAELEAAASRVAAALEVLQEAGAWSPKVVAAPATQPQPAPVVTMPSVRFSEAEIAERNRLVAKMRDVLPDDIAKAERTP